MHECFTPFIRQFIFLLLQSDYLCSIHSVVPSKIIICTCLGRNNTLLHKRVILRQPAVLINYTTTSSAEFGSTERQAESDLICNFKKTIPTYKKENTPKEQIIVILMPNLQSSNTSPFLSILKFLKSHSSNAKFS